MNKEEFKKLFLESFDVTLSTGWIRDEWSLIVTLKDKDTGAKQVLTSIPTRTIKE